jgi:hypothetical protein
MNIGGDSWLVAAIMTRPEALLAVALCIVVLVVGWRLGSRWMERDPKGWRPAVVGLSLGAVATFLLVLILALLGQSSVGGP